MKLSPAAWLIQQLENSPNKWFQHSPEEWKSLSSPKRSNVLDAEDLEEWGRFLKTANASAAVLENWKRLSHPDALCVVAGQQAGLMGGPLYTAWKSLSALQWARRLERAWKRPVIPVFWVASDDHDFEEVSTVSAVVERKLLSRSWPELNTQLGHSVGELPVNASHFADTEFGFSPLPTSNQNLEQHFLEQYFALFGELGMVPISPRLGFLRKASCRLLLKELGDGGRGTQLLVEKFAELEAEGLDGAGIQRKGTELNFFWHRAEGRCRLERVAESEEIQAISPVSGQSVWLGTQSELEEIVHQQPGNFSPNAAMRPLVQDLALATAAFIGGPSELIYHGQIAPLYTLYEVQRPFLIPRTSLTLVPPRVSRYLRKMELGSSDVLSQDSDELQLVIGRKSDTESALQRLDFQTLALQNELDQLQSLLEENRDLRLEEYLEKIRRYVKRGTEKIQRRMVETLSHRAEVQGVQLEEVLAYLKPAGAPQERVLTCNPTLRLLLGERAMVRLNAAVDFCDWRFHLVVEISQLPE
jgi:bacillithiol biosynthesis cysteine-adding enzyme BshC